MSDIPFADDAQWSELPFHPYAEDPEGRPRAGGVKYLFNFSDGELIADSEGNVFQKEADGPVQGACVVWDGEHFAQFDGGSLFRPADRGEHESFRQRIEERQQDERAEALSTAGGEAVVALRRLYRLNDGDEAAVGELMYEIDKAARRTWQEVKDEPDECWVFLRGNLSDGFKVYGPYPNFDEAAEDNDFEEGWGMQAHRTDD